MKLNNYELYLIDRYVKYMENVNNCKFNSDEIYELEIDAKYNGFSSIVENLLNELEN